MVAAIAGFRSRADLGLRKPTSVSYNINPSRGGATPHWGGSSPIIRTHADCENTWRGWQDFHMNTRGWADIAYNAGFCQHGYALAGRGLGVRSAANGTNDGNYRFHAFVWVGGKGMKPSQEAYSAFEWLVLAGRERGAGSDVIPHRYFTGSECPGPELIHHASTIHRKPIATTKENVMDARQEERVVASLTRIEKRLDRLEDEYGWLRPAVRYLAREAGAATKIEKVGRELEI